MVLYKVLQLLIVSNMAFPQGAKVDELLSYECARNISRVANSEDQTGPVFFHGRLVFTSLEARDASKLLIVNAGAGNFVVTLDGAGVNRIRFDVPTTKGKSQTFFLSYLHGGVMRSRYFDYSESRPPAGRDELDYALVPARRAENLLPHLDFAIHETAGTLLTAIVDGKLARSQLSHHRVEHCEHVARNSPNLGKNLKLKLDQIDLILAGPKIPRTNRMPASVVVNH